MAIGSPPNYMGPKNIPANRECALVHLCLTLRGIQAWWVCYVMLSLKFQCSSYERNLIFLVKRFEGCALYFFFNIVGWQTRPTAPPDVKWSPLPIDICNTRGLANALPTQRQS